MQRRLLVLDDDELVGAFVRQVAEGIGYSVTATTSPEEFLLVVSERAPAEIILDLQLGGRDGVEVLRVLGSQGCPARITLLSGFDEKVLFAARELGADLGLRIGKALTKPVRAATLREALSGDAATAPLAAAAELAAAISAGELFLEYQPIVSCASGVAQGVEALVRWQRADGVRVPPDRFIPVAEAAPELMDALTLAVARGVAADARTMSLAGIAPMVAINISARNLRRLDFPERLATVLERNGVQPARIKLEVTETAATTDPLVTLDVLLRLRLKGFSLAVDDFGTGSTSIAMLRRLPYSELKIDRSFVKDMLTAADAHAVVMASIALARSMNLETVAEGVETADVMKALRHAGATSAQGYLMSRPLPVGKLIPWLLERRMPQEEVLRPSYRTTS